MEKLCLNNDWNLYPLDRESVSKKIKFFKKDSLSFNLPCDIHSVLFNNKLICDPFYQDNELELQYLGNITWVVEKNLKIENYNNYESIFIKLSNVDTVCKFFVNEKLVSSFDNLFHGSFIDLKSYLKDGDNNFKFIFYSAEEKAIDNAKKLDYFIPYSVYPVSSVHRNLVRKTQCHSGWDWGPCFMCCGIYDDINLYFTNNGYIDSVKCNTSKIGKDSWNLETIVSYYSIKECNCTLKLNINNCDFETNVDLKVGLNKIKVNNVIKNIKPWYPNEVGDQVLYKLTTLILDSKDERKIGFREIKVDTSDKGLSFYVNDKLVFIKGTNWIPQDSFYGNYSDQRYDFLISSCKDAHMNMIRVWGGGHYEKEVFYDLCDEKGILIWQEAMFSCSLYPSNQEFLESVEKELVYQVNRLQSHACIALWCGNNEDLGAITWYEESKSNRDRYVIDYDRLNEGVVHRTIKKEDPHRFWWPSSPCAGENDYSDNWHDDTKGDMHFWSVWHEGKDFENYYCIKPRFVSEFGYQSFPSLKCISSFSSEKDLNLTSPVMEHHQKNPRGNSIILENFCRYYRFPTTFENQVYLSQVQQAKAMKMAIEYFRSLRDTCTGTMYWQLNDTWPSISWSSIDYTNKFKALHYEAFRFYNNTLLTFRKDEDKLLLSYVNDTDKDIVNTLNISVYNFEGKVLKTEKTKLTLKKNSASLIKEFNIIDYDVNNSFIYASFDDIYSYSLFDKPKRCNLEDPNIKLDIKEDKDNFIVNLSSDKIAFNVFVDTKLDGNFSDNNFLLINNKTISFKKNNIDLNTFKQSIKVFDLFNSCK